MVLSYSPASGLACVSVVVAQQYDRNEHLNYLLCCSAAIVSKARSVAFTDALECVEDPFAQRRGAYVFLATDSQYMCFRLRTSVIGRHARAQPSHRDTRGGAFCGPELRSRTSERRIVTSPSLYGSGRPCWIDARHMPPLRSHAGDVSMHEAGPSGCTATDARSRLV